MESIKKYTLTVFNTCTQEYEEVAVTEEVYRAYYRTGWNIKDNTAPTSTRWIRDCRIRLLKERSIHCKIWGRGEKSRLFSPLLVSG